MCLRVNIVNGSEISFGCTSSLNTHALELSRTNWYEFHNWLTDVFGRQHWLCGLRWPFKIDGTFRGCVTYTDSKGTVKVFTDRVFRQHGFPAAITSDKKSSPHWKGLEARLQRAGHHLGMLTADGLQIDGPIIRLYCIIEDIVRNICADTSKRCRPLLPVVGFAINWYLHAFSGNKRFYKKGSTRSLVRFTLPLRGSGMVGKI